MNEISDNRTGIGSETIVSALQLTPQWILNLPVHFQAHWFFIATVACTYFLFQHDWLDAAVISLLVGVSAYLLYPYTRSVHKTTTAEAESTAESASNRALDSEFKVLHLNVQIRTQSYTGAADLIREHQPDFISLSEVNDEWMKGLSDSGVLRDYPYEECAHNSFLLFEPHRVTLLSKVPFESVTIFYAKPEEKQDATIVASVKVGDTILKIAAMHPRVPLSPFYFSRQVNHFNMLGKLKDELSGPLVVMGDMNATPWLVPFRRMLNGLSLRDARLDVGGLSNTWPAPYTCIGIPLDYLLLSKEIEVHEFKVGPFVGSDHLPLLAKLSIKQPRMKTAEQSHFFT